MFGRQLAKMLFTFPKERDYALIYLISPHPPPPDITSEGGVSGTSTTPQANSLALKRNAAVFHSDLRHITEAKNALTSLSLGL